MSESGRPISADIQVPGPRWGRRLAAIGAGCAALLAGVWGAWHYEANRRFQSEVDALIARGERVWPQQFNRMPVAEEANAARYLIRAAEVMDGTVFSPSNSYMFWRDEVPFPREWYEAAAAVVAANGEVFELIQYAREHATEVDWEIRFESPGAENVSLTGLDRAHELAMLCVDAALYGCFTGDMDRAFDRIEDVLFIAGVAGDQGTLVSHMAANEIVSMALHALQLMAAGLEIDEDTSAELDTARMRGMIRRLLEEDDRSANFLVAMSTERMLVVNYVQTERRNTLLLRPLLLMDGPRALRVIDRVSEAAKQPDWQAASRIAPEPSIVLWNTPSGELPRRRLASGLSEEKRSLSRAARVGYQGTTERRLTAVALAVRLHDLERGGYPESLEELIPDYLPYVPIDPLSADGDPLRYLVAGEGDRPIVYSVGLDGVDQTDDELTLPTWAMHRRQPPQRGGAGTVVDDQWRDLSSWQDTNPTDYEGHPYWWGTYTEDEEPGSSEAVENEPEEPGDPG